MSQVKSTQQLENAVRNHFLILASFTVIVHRCISVLSDMSNGLMDQQLGTGSNYYNQRISTFCLQKCDI